MSELRDQTESKRYGNIHITLSPDGDGEKLMVIGARHDDHDLFLPVQVLTHEQGIDLIQWLKANLQEAGG